MPDKSIVDLSQKINRIPHLNLTKYLPEVPLESMMRELFQFRDTDFYPYISGNTDPKIVEHMAKNWHAFLLIDTCKSGRHNIDYITTTNNYDRLEYHTDSNGDYIYKPTDVGQMLPDTLSYLYNIAESPEKTRMSKIMPEGGNATWHSHKLLADSGDKRFSISDRDNLANGIITPVIQIPLITNKDVWMGVCEKYPYKEADVKKYWQHYYPGEVWLFNSYYFHNAVNNGKNPRIHIMMYVPLTDSKMFNAIKQAADEYTGPLLSGTEVSYT